MSKVFTRTLFLLALIVLVFSLFSACTSAPEQTSELSPALAAKVDAVENQLKPRRVIAGNENTLYTLTERMEHYKVPGVSIAIIEDNTVAWAKGYGERRADSGEEVNAETRFQAASISKGVAALGALLLMQNGKLDIDADINSYLTRWQLPAMEGNDTAVTAKMLMSHTGGLTVHGFPGYSMADSIPAVEQVLDGADPANTDPVRIDTAPGTAWSYSGGGYTILQLLVEEVSGEPFEEYMNTALLDPLGMERSTFRHIPPSSANVAVAHDGRGVPGTGAWHIYPEMAAAGLWTTPTDLAEYIIAVEEAKEGSSDLIEADTASLMTKPVMEDYALGLAVYEQDGEPVISHGGSNWGYRCFLKYWPDRDLGIVVMTNSDNGGSLYPDIVDAFARQNGLHASEQQMMEIDTSVDPAIFADFVGTYYIEAFDHSIDVIMQDGIIYVEDDMTAPWQLHPKSENRYFTLEESAEIEFQRDESGQVTEARIIFRGQEFEAKRQ